MYLHLGGDTVVFDRNIIGIFDIENTSVSKYTRNFLSSAGKNGNAVSVSYEMPKSFILCNDLTTKVNTVFISQVSVSTLKKRNKGF